MSIRHTLLLAACAALACLSPAAAAQTAPASSDATPAGASKAPASPQAPSLAGLQFVYGSGEGAAMSEAIYRALADYAVAEAAHRPDDSVILADGASLDAPTYVPCDDKPLAVVLDVDETVVLNTGLMRQRAPGNASEGPADYSVRPVPGAVEAIGSLRAAGITVIYNTNRPASMSDSTIATLASIGLDKPVHRKTLFLSGEDGMGANKDGRRGKIAARWCVVAMAGDQLGDFSQLFEQIGSVAARREATLNDPIARNWGHGWFVLPNTAYGTALKGNLADIFPEAAPAANDN